MKKFIVIIAIVLLSISLTACSNNDTNFKKVNGDEAREVLEQNENAVIIDVRTIEEYNAGHISDAVLIPVDVIEQQITILYPNKDTHIILYCRSGNRSSIAANTLKDLGYNNIYDLGAYTNW